MFTFDSEDEEEKDEFIYFEGEEVFNEELSRLPLQCQVQGQATFPNLVFRDIRWDASSSSSSSHKQQEDPKPMYLWETFHLAELNGHLTRPLSFEEVKFNFLSSPDLSTLHRYSFNFIPNNNLNPFFFQL